MKRLGHCSLKEVRPVAEKEGVNVNEAGERDVKRLGHCSLKEVRPVAEKEGVNVNEAGAREM